METTMAATEGYWFRSTRFRVVPDEDMDVNPGLYGRQLAYWLRDRLAAQGWPEARVTPEDWGWCVVCQQRPFLLWIGCGGIVAEEDAVLVHRDAQASGAIAPLLAGQVPVLTDSLVWHCFVEVECGWWARLFGRGAMAAAEQRRLDGVLRGLLTGDPEIQFVEE